MDFYAWAIDEPSHEREIILRLGAAGMFVVCAIVLYCVVPMSGDLWWVATLAGPLAGILLTPLALTSTQRILASDQPVLAVANALVLSATVLILGFSCTYYAMTMHDPTQFEDLETKLDAVYFTVTVLSTVGFGDIHAQGQAGRAVVTLQIGANFLFVVGFVGLVRWAGKRRVDTGRSAASLREELKQKRDRL